MKKNESLFEAMFKVLELSKKIRQQKIEECKENNWTFISDCGNEGAIIQEISMYGGNILQMGDVIEILMYMDEDLQFVSYEALKEIVEEIFTKRNKRKSFKSILKTIKTYYI